VLCPPAYAFVSRAAAGAMAALTATHGFTEPNLGQ
jgi:hypothetical protein